MGKLVCIGGGEIPRIKNGVELPHETKAIDETIVKLANKENPKLLFIGTASGPGSYNYYLIIKKVYENLGCKVSNLDLLADDLNIEEVKNSILNTDIIYVGGGDTKFMLEKWRELGVDKLLIQAYDKGVICSGISAGSCCWFKYNHDEIKGLGLIDAVNCVHFDQKETEAREKYFNIIKKSGLSGIALENCTAILYLDDEIRVIKSNKEKKVYEIKYTDGVIERTEIQ